MEESMKTLSASLIVIALATGAGHAQLSAATDAAARTTQQTELERTGPVDLRGRSDVSGQLRQDLHAETPRSRLEQMRLDRAEREARQTGEVAARARSDVEARADAAMEQETQATTRSSVRGEARIKAPDTRPVRREARDQAVRTRGEVREATPSAEARADVRVRSRQSATVDGNDGVRARSDAQTRARVEAEVDGPDRR
jgi:hypothetical protein